MNLRSIVYQSADAVSRSIFSRQSFRRLVPVVCACLVAILVRCPTLAGEVVGEDANEGKTVIVTLVSGAKITAPLLRQNEHGIVLDLGDDVLSLKAQRVLNIRRQQSGEAGSENESGFFTTGRLEEAPLSAHVRRFGDAIVVVKTPVGLGSGFIISDQGHLITNYHVIEQSLNISVTVFQRGDEGYQRRQIKNVKILATQPLRDLALLQIPPQDWESLTIRPVIIARDESLRVGDMIFSIGNPLGLERSATQGIVSSISRTIGHLRFIQTDASINPGNSGGPMFNSRGEVVGVVCAGFTSMHGLAFGIPGSDLVDFLMHREAFLFDPARPQNGVTYLPPPYITNREQTDAVVGDPEKESTAAEQRGSQ